MKPCICIAVLCALLSLLPISVSAAPTAQYTADGALPAVTEPADGILPLIFCRNKSDLAAGKVTWQAGRNGQAAVLNGTDAYFRSDGALLHREDLAFTLWVNWADAATLPAGQRLLSVRGDDRNTRYMALSPNGGENGEGLCLEMQMEADTVTLSAEQPSPLAAGWHHLAVVWKGASLQLYLDGALLDDKIAPASPKDFDIRQLCVGKGMRTGEDGYFAGMVDDVIFYNRPLTADEVAALAHRSEETTAATTTATTTATVTTTATTAARPTAPVSEDPLQPRNRLWLLTIPAAAALGLAATARPRKRKG